MASLSKKFSFLPIIFYLMVSCANPSSPNSETVAYQDEGRGLLTPREQPTVTIEEIQAGWTEITLSLKALPGTILTAWAHTQPDFSDKAAATASIEAKVEFLQLKLTGLDGGGKYYIRVQGENAQGETSITIPSDKPFSLHLAYITDAIPSSGKVIVDMKTTAGLQGKVQASLNKEFTSIVKETAFTGSTEPQTLEISGLSNETPYYLRILPDEGGTAYPYSTPLIPTAKGKQYIHRLSELAKIGVDTINYPANWNYELRMDLDFSDADNNGVKDDSFDNDNNPANGNWAPLTPSGYAGSFDGRNHSIDGMIIITPTDNEVGLFGVMTSEGEIKHLKRLMGMVSGGRKTGVLVGYSAGSIVGSYATGSVTGHEIFVGGLVGYSIGPIKDSFANVIVVGQAHGVGGLTGYSGAAITDSYASGSVTGLYSVGGLVGMHYGAAITDSYATGSVTGTELHSVGGLVGDNVEATIASSHATGEVSGNSYVGALAGRNENGSITSSYATGSVTGDSFVGGLAGWNESGSITSSYATGSVTGESYVGGLVGDNNATITNSYATGNVLGNQSGTVGGLLGFQTGSNAIITNSYRYENQSITDSEGKAHTAPNTFGSAVTLEQLKTSSWYTDPGNLGWSAETWLIEGRVNATTPYHPHIKDLPGQPNTPLPTPPSS